MTAPLTASLCISLAMIAIPLMLIFVDVAPKDRIKYGIASLAIAIFISLLIYTTT